MPRGQLYLVTPHDVVIAEGTSRLVPRLFFAIECGARAAPKWRTFLVTGCADGNVDVHPCGDVPDKAAAEKLLSDIALGRAAPPPAPDAHGEES